MGVLGTSAFNGLLNTGMVTSGITINGTCGAGLGCSGGGGQCGAGLGCGGDGGQCGAGLGCSGGGGQCGAGLGCNGR